MGKWAIPTIEVTGLVACIIFGVLWLIDPDSQYEALMAISGLVFIVTEGLRRYLAKRESGISKLSHSLLDINAENTLFTRFLNRGNKKTGNIGIAFYELKIVNISNEPDLPPKT